MALISYLGLKNQGNATSLRVWLKFNLVVAKSEIEGICAIFTFHGPEMSMRKRNLQQ